jgi:hypothetical protein
MLLLLPLLLPLSCRPCLWTSGMAVQFSCLG